MRISDWSSDVCSSDLQVMVMMCVALSALTLSIANIAYWPVYAAFAAPVSLSAAFGFALSDRYGSVLLSIGAVAMTAALLMISHRLARSVLRAQRRGAAHKDRQSVG